MKMCRDRRLRPGAVVTRRLSRRGGHGIRSVGGRDHLFGGALGFSLKRGGMSVGMGCIFCGCMFSSAMHEISLGLKLFWFR
jgi:hypothetical protein